MAIDVLDKTLMPMYVETFLEYHHQFDVQKIKEFEVYPNAAIKDFDLVNAPSTFFDRQRKFIDAVFLISPFLIFLILGLVHNIYMRIRSEKELKAIELEKSPTKTKLFFLYVFTTTNTAIFIKIAKLPA